MEFRNEIKYNCSELEWNIIKERLSHCMRFDEHAGDNNEYRIRSLYFDDYFNTAFYDNDAGVRNRRKFRIRVYDDVKSRIQLEVKYKVHGKTRKESCKLTLEECEKLMYGEIPEFREDMPLPLKHMYYEMSTRLLRPRIIIEYERCAYVEPVGNVRITFDKNISYSNHISDFLEDKIPLTPLLETGQHVLEVKYDEFLPAYIAQAMEIKTLKRTSFSKFYLSCVKAN
ncbi:MAG: polyphosphate polymerase domain-containing protein [Lachnospiraceae bacterium]|nr:polyphosphate polymerase domain-containing protein [Lachnospiraceae bacterium]